jgi:hypothetical protein
VLGVTILSFSIPKKRKKGDFYREIDCFPQQKLSKLDFEGLSG